MIVRITGLAPTPAIVSFAAFAAANADLAGCGEPSPQTIYERLAAGEAVQLGGGASPLVTLEAIQRHDDTPEAA